MFEPGLLSWYLPGCNTVGCCQHDPASNYFVIQCMSSDVASIYAVRITGLLGAICIKVLNTYMSPVR